LTAPRKLFHAASDDPIHTSLAKRLFTKVLAMGSYGCVLRWFVTGTEIEALKQAEERVQNENLALREEIDKASTFEEIVGTSSALQGQHLQALGILTVHERIGTLLKFDSFFSGRGTESAGLGSLPAISRTG
jgi:hypothetical protein